MPCFTPGKSKMKYMIDEDMHYLTKAVNLLLCIPEWYGPSCLLWCWQHHLCAVCSSGWHFYSWEHTTQDCACQWKHILTRVPLLLVNTNAGRSSGAFSPSPPWSGAFVSTAPDQEHMMWKSCHIVPLETNCHVQHNTHALVFFWPSINRFPGVDLHIPGIAVSITDCPDLDSILA